MNTWGNSWGTAWGNSWGTGDTPVVVVQDGVKPSGGIPAPEPREWRPFEERDPYRFSIQARRVIEAVATEQVQHLDLDEQQKLEHLARELEHEDIEVESRYFEYLTHYREQLIAQEIKTLLKKKDDEEAMLLILIAANLT